MQYECYSCIRLHQVLKLGFLLQFLKLLYCSLAYCIGWLLVFLCSLAFVRTWDFCSAASFESQKERGEVQLSKDTCISNAEPQHFSLGVSSSCSSLCAIDGKHVNH